MAAERRLTAGRHGPADPFCQLCRCSLRAPFHLRRRVLALLFVPGGPGKKLESF